MFILKKGHQPGVYVPLRALFLVVIGVTLMLVANIKIEKPLKYQIRLGLVPTVQGLYQGSEK